jgi:serine/threonine protein kinase/tetratricopeptide (TPR) repeat protein
MKSRIAARLFDEDLAPVRIAHYEIIRTIGAGGMGVVYAARDAKLDRIVALKRVARSRMSEQARERMLDEARTMAKLSQPNVVQIYEVGEHDGDIYIAMEFIDGQTLAQWQRERRPLVEILEIYRQAGAGLVAAHVQGIVHRDFKPANVLLGKDGRVRVADFGLAVEALVPTPADSSDTSDSTAATRLAGTPDYMAPEVFDGARADQRADQFSFCVSLWEAVAGVRPGRNALEPWPGPRWLETLLRRGLAPHPSQRWPSLEALLVELERRPSRRRRRGFAVLALIVLGSVAGTFAALQGPKQPAVCENPSSAFERVWNPSRERVLATRLEASELDQPARSVEIIAHAYGRFGRHWVATRRSSCDSLDWASPAFARSDACLQRGLAKAENLLDEIGEGQLGAQASIAALLAELGDPRRCSLEAQLIAAPEPPPELRAAVARDYWALDAVRLKLAAGELEDAQLELAMLGESDAVHEFGPLRAELGVVEGTLRVAQQRHGEALELFVESAALAEQLELAPVSFAARRELVRVQVRHFEDLAAAQAWLRLSEVPARVLDDTGVQRELAVAEAEVFALAGEPARAETSLRRALEGVAEDDLATQHLRLQLANSWAAQGRSEDARRAYGELEADWKRLLGPRHPSLGALYFNMGLAMRDRGEVDEARAYLESARTIQTAVFGARSPKLAPLLTMLADLANDEADYATAIELATLAAELQLSLPAGHSERGTALMALGWAQVQSGSLMDGLATHELLFAELHEQLDPINRAYLHQTIGWLRCRVETCDGARPHFERALADGTELTKLQARLGLANVELAEGRPQEAVMRIEELLPRFESWSREEDPEGLALAQWMLARALVDAGSPPGAARVRALVSAAMRGYEQLPPRVDIDTDLQILASLAGE